jgi:hypothetical protein
MDVISGLTQVMGRMSGAKGNSSKNLITTNVFKWMITSIT